MTQYRKKPVVIEAFQWTGDTSAVLPWADTACVSFEPLSKKLTVKTLEGTLTADLGDYVIRGVQGEVYPCKPDIFEQTYDVVSDEPKEVAPYKAVEHGLSVDGVKPWAVYGPGFAEGELRSPERGVAEEMASLLNRAHAAGVASVTRMQGSLEEQAAGIAPDTRQRVLADLRNVQDLSNEIQNMVEYIQALALEMHETLD